MKVIEKEKYKILRKEEEDLPGFATYLSKNHDIFKNDNVVIDLLSRESVDSKELLSFLEISNLHRRLKHSFVIAAKDVSIDTIPEDLIVVPTMQEAEDIINMEEVERELGF